MRRTVAATLLASAVLAATAAAPAAGAAPSTLTQINATPYALAEGGSFAKYAPRVTALDAKLANAKVADVLADANRTATAGCHGAASFCWDSGDNSTADWYPQGLSGSWDATGGQPKMVLTSWYNKTGDKGVRLTFADYHDPAHVKYRHALLVEPTAADNFGPVKVHAGGIALVGDYLYVVDTAHGLRVFDLRHIWRTAADPGKSKIGKQSDGKYYAYDYRYVVAQVGSYRQSGSGDCDPPPSSLTAPLCFSYIGVDRSTSPPSLLTGEYYNGKAGARLVRWSLAADGKLATGKAAAAYQSPHQNLQGAVSYKGEFASSRSQSASKDGVLYDERVGAAATSSSLPPGPEDLSYDPAAKRVWTLTEHPGSRTVLGVALTLG
ncbi:hypothetical protein GCM10010174_04020 [Kutzneria viridogrisea]|uniref:Secreted protein n=1 Tax=Kutzneria viridogrisea TaxID=47990 RepID=A0ABR6BSH4_9PSEU|nr:hypothetical protein [Kutzneria viridogrisea]